MELPVLGCWEKWAWSHLVVNLSSPRSPVSSSARWLFTQDRAESLGAQNLKWFVQSRKSITWNHLTPSFLVTVLILRACLIMLCTWPLPGHLEVGPPPPLHYRGSEAQSCLSPPHPRVCTPSWVISPNSGQRQSFFQTHRAIGSSEEENWEGDGSSTAPQLSHWALVILWGLFGITLDLHSKSPHLQGPETLSCSLMWHQMDSE